MLEIKYFFLIAIAKTVLLTLFFTQRICNKFVGYHFSVKNLLLDFFSRNGTFLYPNVCEWLYYKNFSDFRIARIGINSNIIKLHFALC